MLPIETSCFPAATLCVWHDKHTFDPSKMTLDTMQDFEQGRRFVALDSHLALADEHDEPSIRS